MKQIFAPLLLLCIVATAFVSDTDKSLARVQQVQGFYVFTDATPVAEYEFLGTVKSSVGWSGQYVPVRDKLLKLARKQYPNGNGVLLHLVNEGTDRADVIRFK